jgi:hypothetical protein
MTEATIKIPGNIDIKKVSDEIIYKAFAIAVEKRRKEIRNELKRVEAKIRRFEKKYKMTFTEYEKEMGDTVQAHDDWIDWSFLEEVRKDLNKEFENFQYR